MTACNWLCIMAHWCRTYMYCMYSQAVKPSRCVSSLPHPLSSNRHHRSNDDCLDGKRENCQVCSVQYCVQQLSTVQCTHIGTDLMVVCWLHLAFLWLYCVLQFICVRLSLLGIFCVIVYLCMCAFVELALAFFQYYAKRFARKNISEMNFVSSGA